MDNLWNSFGENSAGYTHFTQSEPSSFVVPPSSTSTRPGSPALSTTTSTSSLYDRDFSLISLCHPPSDDNFIIWNLSRAQFFLEQLLIRHCPDRAFLASYLPLHTILTPTHLPSVHTATTMGMFSKARDGMFLASQALRDDLRDLQGCMTELRQHICDVDKFVDMWQLRDMMAKMITEVVELSAVVVNMVILPILAGLEPAMPSYTDPRTRPFECLSMEDWELVRRTIENLANQLQKCHKRVIGLIVVHPITRRLIVDVSDRQF